MSLFNDLPIQAAPPRLAQTPRGAPMGHAAVMAGRIESADSLDFFPTPPWVARCIVGEILPALTGPWKSEWGSTVIWEPACGAGHMAGPLAETGAIVHCSDVADYGWANPDGRAPRIGSFVDMPGAPGIAAPREVHWIITNPPFNLSLAFVRRAVAVAKVGVAIVTRLSWLESAERWALRQEHPLYAVANFAERVPMFRGRWEPGGSSATAYAVMIWAPGWYRSMPSSQHIGLTVAPGAAQRWSLPGDAQRWGGSFPRLDGIAFT